MLKYTTSEIIEVTTDTVDALSIVLSTELKVGQRILKRKAGSTVKFDVLPDQMSESIYIDVYYDVVERFALHDRETLEDTCI